MANEVVKHHNDLNTIPMRRWKKEEMNFFFAIIAKLRDKGTKEVVFDKYSLADLANYSIRANKDYEDVISKLVNNILSISYLEKKETKLNGKPAYSLKRMNLFNSFEAKWTTNLEDLELIVKVSEEFEYVLNRLDSEFLTYELSEFTQIRSTYSKTLYRLLKQWRSIGVKEYSIKELKTLLDTPKYYAPSHINKNILIPAKEELPKFFNSFKVKTIKSNKRGTPVIGYLFTWEPEKTNGKWIEGKYDSKRGITKIIQPEYSKNDETDNPEEIKSLLQKIKKDEVQTTIEDI